MEMKKANLYSMKRLPKYISKEDLEKLNTKRLLSYLKHLNKCQESFEKSDNEIKLEQSGIHIKYKNSEIWMKAYENVKSILNKREHIEK